MNGKPTDVNYPPAPTSPAAASSYDQIPYGFIAFPQTDPAHLGTIATLFGMTPPEPRHCRVLEIGCARGGNIIPLAQGSPNSQFLGIDLSAGQIAEGQAIVGELGLANIELRHADVLNLGDELGRFDYIICHGVYSWVPPPVQNAILRLCKHNLADQGVAYVSYNCYPGWHGRMAIRQMLCHHVRRLTDPHQRIAAARAVLEFLHRTVAADGEPDYAALLGRELALIKDRSDSYFLHESLDQCNEPLYFHEFIRRAADQGLQYLGEAQVSRLSAADIGEEPKRTLGQICPDRLSMEQHLDFLRNRRFRQTLLCHAGLPLADAPRQQMVRSLHISFANKPQTATVDVQSEATVEFVDHASGTIVTNDRLMKSALACLIERWPGGMTFGELLAGARDRLGPGAEAAPVDDEQHLSAGLLQCYLSGILKFTIAPPAFQPLVTRHPVASPYARLRARHDVEVVTAKLETAVLDDQALVIFRLLDGTRDAAALTEALAQWLLANAPPNQVPTLTAEAARQQAAKSVGLSLGRFAQMALLVQ